MVRLLPEYNFLVIGPQGISNETNLIFTGEIYGQRLEDLLRTSLAGISSMDLGLIGMKEASPLKTRLYLSRGMPVIARYKDSAIPEDANYFYQFSSSEEVSDSEITKLREFLDLWQNKRVKNSELSCIDSKIIEQKRINFLLSACQG